MEVVKLHPNALKAPQNFHTLLFGASESGKSTFLENLIRNKAKVFQSPRYEKFIYCSPHMGSVEAS